MIVVCEDKLSELQEDEKNHAGNVIAPVKDEINKIFENKPYEELQKLQLGIQQKLSGKEPVEIEYWEQQLKLLTVWKAKVKIIYCYCLFIQKSSLILTFYVYHYFHQGK